MFKNAEDFRNKPDKILDLCTQIEDYTSLLCNFLLVTEASFCQHTYSSSSKINLSDSIQTQSNLSKINLTICLENLAGRLKYRGEESQVTPSHIWKRLKSMNLNKKFDALIVGASKELTKELRTSDRYLIVEAHPNSSNNKFECEQEIQAISINPSYLYEKAKPIPPTSSFSIELIHKHNFPEELLNDLYFLAEDHTCGDTPVSFISIPISYYASSSVNEQDFLAIEIVWVGKDTIPYSIDFSKHFIDSLVNLCLRVSPQVVHELVDIYHICDYQAIIKALELNNESNKDLKPALDIVLRGGTAERMRSRASKLKSDKNKKAEFGGKSLDTYISRLSKLLKQYVKNGEDKSIYNDENPCFVRYVLEDRWFSEFSEEDQRILPKKRKDDMKEAIKKSREKRKKQIESGNYDFERIGEEFNAERLHFALIELFPPKL